MGRADLLFGRRPLAAREAKEQITAWQLPDGLGNRFEIRVSMGDMPFPHGAIVWPEKKGGKPIDDMDSERIGGEFFCFEDAYLICRGLVIAGRMTGFEAALLLKEVIRLNFCLTTADTFEAFRKIPEQKRKEMMADLSVLKK